MQPAISCEAAPLQQHDEILDRLSEALAGRNVACISVGSDAQDWREVRDIIVENFSEDNGQVCGYSVFSQDFSSDYYMVVFKYKGDRNGDPIGGKTAHLRRNIVTAVLNNLQGYKERAGGTMEFFGSEIVLNSGKLSVQKERFPGDCRSVLGVVSGKLGMQPSWAKVTKGAMGAGYWQRRQK